MKSADLIVVIEKEPQKFMTDMIAQLRSNPGTSHYHRLPQEEVFRRAYAVFQHLAQYLTYSDLGAVERQGESLGKQRFEEGAPLGQVVLALVLNEKHITNWWANPPDPPDAQTEQAVSVFFERTIYSTARGYSAALEEKSLPTVYGDTREGSTSTRSPSQRPAGKEQHGDISRGGQIGEHGG